MIRFDNIDGGLILTMISRLFILICFLTIIIVNAKTQDTILLINPSFEDVPRLGGDPNNSMDINGWHDCGHQMISSNSPPDIHPTNPPAWGVTMFPYDHDTYLGLVVRYDGTYESLSQKLIQSIKAGKCYSMSVYLAKSSIYFSPTPRSEGERFTNPVSFRVWGGDDFCDKKELLMESGPVVNSEWEKYDFSFLAKRDYSSITIEAYFMSHIAEKYNGHVLVDHISSIMETKCK